MREALKNMLKQDGVMVDDTQLDIYIRSASTSAGLSLSFLLEAGVPEAVIAIYYFIMSKEKDNIKQEKVGDVAVTVGNSEGVTYWDQFVRTVNNLKAVYRK